jgi:hypothetical protein
MFGMRTSGVHMSELFDWQKVEKLQTEGFIEIRENRVFPTST